MSVKRDTSFRSTGTEGSTYIAPRALSESQNAVGRIEMTIDYDISPKSGQNPYQAAAHRAAVKSSGSAYRVVGGVLQLATVQDKIDAQEEQASQSNNRYARG